MLYLKKLKEMLKEYKDTLDKGLETNKESVESYYSVCKVTDDILKAEKVLSLLYSKELKQVKNKRYIIINKC